MSAPKLSESIPAVTRPVRLPRIVPGRARYLAGLITAGVVGVLALVLMCVGIAVTL